MRRTSPLLVVLALALVVLGGCGGRATTASSSASSTGSTSTQPPVPVEKNPPGDIPDSTAFVPFKAAGGFSIKVPEGWARRGTANSVEFTDKLNTVRAIWSQSAAAPTAKSVKRNDLAVLAKSEAAFHVVEVKTVTLTSGPAILTLFKENSAPNSVTGKQYRMDVERFTLWRGGTRVDLWLLSPVGADNVDPWRIVSESFTWK